MRKFAWIFMAAMTVAGFSACSNSEDEDLPGTGGDGGEGGNPSTPSVVVKIRFISSTISRLSIRLSMSCARVGLTRLFPRLTMTVHGKARFLQVRQMAR